MSEAWDSSHGPARSWQSGQWSLELRDDEFADVAFDGRVVLRAVRAVVRDRDWNTATLVVDRVDEHGPVLALHVRSENFGADLRGVVRAEARPTGLRFLLDVESGAAFDTNRTGLVVLHPPTLAGAPLQVTHSDGSVEASAFPSAIAPHQPVFDIAGLRWTADDLEVGLRFAGDVFEMEDQRNWTDASFKTYSRPLELPYPYRLAAGERVEQWAEVSVSSSGAAVAPADADVVELTPGGVCPDIAVGASTAPDPAPAGIVPVGSAVLVEVDLATPHWRAALTRAAVSGVPLDVRLVLTPDDPERLREAARMLASVPLAGVAAFDPELHVSDAAAVAALRSALEAAGVAVPVLGGARSHFTELNREHHRLPNDLDGVVFSITPLFHSSTTEQLVESIGMQRLVAQQAAEIAGEAPVHVGPVTLRARFNNVATTAAGLDGPADLSGGYGAALLDADDPRQEAPELAAWTVASAAALAVPGVASIAYFEEWGPRGIRDDSGVDRPVADAVRSLAALSGQRLLSGVSPDGLVWAVGGESADGATVLVANLDREPRTVTVRLSGDTQTVNVSPFAFVRIDR